MGLSILVKKFGCPSAILNRSATGECDFAAEEVLPFPNLIFLSYCVFGRVHGTTEECSSWKHGSVNILRFALKEPYGGRMGFTRRKSCENVLQCDGAPVMLRGARVPGKNSYPRVIALMALCCVFALSSTFATAEQAAPTSSELLEQGQKLLVSGKIAEAELLLDRAEQLAPSDPAILTLDAKVKGRLGEYSSAVDLLKRVTRLTPESAEAHIDLAIALADSGALDGALAETATAISIAPRLSVAHLNRARILSDMNKDREASEEFVLATQFAPQNPDCYFYWSLAEQAQGNFTREAELLQKVVKLEPGNIRAHLRLANNLLDQNRPAEAVAQFRLVLTIDPNSAQALYQLARALHTTHPEESERLRGQYQRLKVQNSILDQAKALGNQAFHDYALQDWRESIRLYSEALETCGDCEIESALHRDLGLSLCRDGQIARGTVELRKALTLNPEDRDAAKALEAVRSLNKTE